MNTGFFRLCFSIKTAKKGSEVCVPIAYLLLWVAKRLRHKRLPPLKGPLQLFRFLLALSRTHFLCFLFYRFFF